MSPGNSKTGLSRSSNQSAEEAGTPEMCHVCSQLVPSLFLCLFLGSCWLKGTESCVRLGVVTPAAPNGDGSCGFGAFLWANAGSGVFLWAGKSCCSQGRTHPRKSWSIFQDRWQE